MDRDILNGLHWSFCFELISRHDPCATTLCKMKKRHGWKRGILLETIAFRLIAHTGFVSDWILPMIRESMAI
jgi:hypothetical protein